MSTPKKSKADDCLRKLTKCSTFLDANIDRMGCRRAKCMSWTTFRDRCAVTLLVVVNFVFLVCGGMLLVLGFLIYVDKDSSIYLELLQRLPSSGPLVVLERLPAIFIGIGCTVVLMSFLGCYGTCTESVCFLCLYTLLLLIILSAELVVGTFLAIFRDQIVQNLETTMQRQISLEYNKTARSVNETDQVTNQVTSVWDAMQVKLRCCGSLGPQDYRNSAWFNNTKKEETKRESGGALYPHVPVSCCRLFNDDPKRPELVDENKCQIDAILFARGKLFSHDLNTQGCADMALDWFASNRGMLASAVLFSIVLQISHFAFACSVLSRLRRSYSDYPWYDEQTFI